jgi:hypothetical protein
VGLAQLLRAARLLQQHLRETRLAAGAGGPAHLEWKLRSYSSVDEMMRVATTVAFVLASFASLAGGQVPSQTASDQAAVNVTDERPRYPLRALLETALFMGGNTAYYWWNKDFNAPDWEMGWDRESWRKKLITFEGVRFDANYFSTNAGSHTEAGTIVYLIGRGNGLDPGWSFLLSTGEVFAWEYLSEFREKVSINDLYTNALGGLAVGEPFFQLSEVFAQGADNGVNRAVALLFSPLSNLNGWGDRRRAGNVDALGLPRDIWHRFDLRVGLGNTHWANELTWTETLLGATSEINTVHGYGRAGVRSGFFGPGRITEIDLDFAISDPGLSAASFATRVALGGYHRQAVSGEGTLLRGHSLVLSLVNTFEYTRRSRPSASLDQIATFGVFGPTAELLHRRGELEARLRVEAIPNLAMVSSLASERYQQLFGTEGIKSVLAQRGYYFGYGVGVGAELAARYRVWEAGIASRWERFGSIEGLDRYQERVTNDFHLVDGRLASAIWLSVRPLQGYGQIGVCVEGGRRFGTIEDLTTTVEERRAALTFALEF